LGGAHAAVLVARAEGFGLEADALATHEAYSVVIVDSMGSSYDYDIDDIGFYIE